MALVRQRVASYGSGLVYIDILWDSKLGVEQEDGSIVYAEPAATEDIYQVWWRNLTADTWEISFISNTKPFLRQIPAGTQEQTNAFGQNQRPNLSEITGISLRQITRTTITG